MAYRRDGYSPQAILLPTFFRPCIRHGRCRFFYVFSLQTEQIDRSARVGDGKKKKREREGRACRTRRSRSHRRCPRCSTNGRDHKQAYVLPKPVHSLISVAPFTLGYLRLEPGKWALSSPGWQSLVLSLPTSQRDRGINQSINNVVYFTHDTRKWQSTSINSTTNIAE